MTNSPPFHFPRATTGQPGSDFKPIGYNVGYTHPIEDLLAYLAVEILNGSVHQVIVLRAPARATG